MIDVEMIDNLVKTMEVEGSASTFNGDEIDLMIDALIFYKEMNTLAI